MPLPAGSQLGPYEILAPLGAGGMGEVYRARDTQLGREVALKTISPKVASNEERKRRFLQEARAASGLNHPGIVTIYDINRSGEVDYMVMEYVRGRTLDRVIGRQGIGVQEAIRYAIQITDALARAHAAHIVHRDLKPGNIMVTDDGQVKILDFGLAKLGEVSEVVVEESDDTRTVQLSESGHTLEGAIVGTAAYMSPEQAEGKKVDERSDIFSFGAVLYEMVTGRRAFTGETSVSTLAAVLKSDPRPPGEITKGIPHDLERIILRCMRKDPARRFQNATDLRVDLEELKETTEPGLSKPATPIAKRPVKWIWIAASVALPLLLVAGWLLRSAGKGGTPHYVPVPLTTFEGTECQPSFSPDGNQVVFSWNGEKRDNYDLYAMVVGSGSSARLTADAAPDVAPSWSPDNRWIAFLRVGQGVFLIPPVGSGERKIAEWPGVTTQLSWSPDGKYLAIARGAEGSEPAGIFVIPVQGGAAKRITRAQSTRHSTPAFSPDGRLLAFASCGGAMSCELLLVKLDRSFGATEPPQRIGEPTGGIQSISWAGDGQSLIAGQITAGETYRLVRISVNAQTRPEHLAFAGSGALDASISRTGSRMAYAQYYADSDIFTIRGDEMSRSPLSSIRNDNSPQYSPDGNRVVFSSFRSGAQEVWVANPDGSGAVQLTTSQASGTPRWSPDGRRIVFDTQLATGQWRIRVVDRYGGQPMQVVSNEAEDAIPSFSRDGKWIYFASSRGGRHEIYRVPSSGGEAVRITEGGGFSGLESMDRKSLYYTKTDGSCVPLFVRSLSGGGERQVVDSVCLRGFVVTGRGIYYIGADSARREYSVQLMDPANGRSTVVYKIDSRLRLGQGLGISPNGDTILVSAASNSGADLMLVEGFR